MNDCKVIVGILIMANFVWLISLISPIIKWYKNGWFERHYNFMEFVDFLMCIIWVVIIIIGGGIFIGSHL